MEVKWGDRSDVNHLCHFVIQTGNYFWVKFRAGWMFFAIQKKFYEVVGRLFNAWNVLEVDWVANWNSICGKGCTEIQPWESGNSIEISENFNLIESTFLWIKSSVCQKNIYSVRTSNFPHKPGSYLNDLLIRYEGFTCNFFTSKRTFQNPQQGSFLICWKT